MRCLVHVRNIAMRHKSTAETFKSHNAAPLFRRWTYSGCLGGSECFTRGHLLREAICWCYLWVWWACL